MHAFSILLPILIRFIPIQDPDFKNDIIMILSVMMANNYFNDIGSFFLSFLRKKKISIPEITSDTNKNPLFHKIQDYLALKYSAQIESCELIPKNGDIEFSLSDMTGKKFTDTCEINNIIYSFDLTVENKTTGLLPSGKCINISSKTAAPSEIRNYVKKISIQQNKDTNMIKILRPLTQGKKKDEKSIEWEPMQVKTNKTLKNTIYSEEIERELFADIDRFMTSEEWYAARGIPYKRGYFLHSLPGQGKTSVAKIVANKYNTPIFCIDLTTISSNAEFTKLMQEISYFAMHEKYILLMEDIDRTNLIKYHRNDKGITMDCFLNAIDGIAEPYGRILILSANEPEKILAQKALMRPGRIDKIIELHACNLSQIQRLYRLFYDEKEHPIIWSDWKINEDLSAAYVVKLLQENVSDSNLFMRLVGELEDKSKEIQLDDTFQKILNKAKGDKTSEKKGKQKARYHAQSKKPIDIFKRAKRNIAKCEQRINRDTTALNKTVSKLPRFLERIRLEEEKTLKRKLREKAAKKAAKIKEQIQQANDLSLDDIEEEDYETPAFMANSIAIDDVLPGTITTYEVVDTYDCMTDLISADSADLAADPADLAADPADLAADSADLAADPADLAADPNDSPVINFTNNSNIVTSASLRRRIRSDNVTE